jgi:hypothetical protein
MAKFLIKMDKNKQISGIQTVFSQWSIQRLLQTGARGWYSNSIFPVVHSKTLTDWGARLSWGD